MSAESVNDALTKNHEQYVANKRKILRAGGSLGELRESCNEFLRLHPQSEISVQFYLTGDICCSVRLGRNDSLKDAAAVMVPFAEWKCNRRNDGLSFDFCFKKDGITVNVWVYPHYASTKCRRVLTETKERPAEVDERYILVCTDGEESEEGEEE